MYELLCGYPPFNATSVDEIFHNITNRIFEMPPIGDEEDCISPSAADLIEKFLNPDYINRFGSNGSDEIRGHPFFKGINWNSIRDNPGFIIPKMIMTE